MSAKQSMSGFYREETGVSGPNGRLGEALREGAGVPTADVRDGGGASYAFRRSERLLNSFGFKRVLRYGCCFRHGVMRVHFKESSRELSRMGLVVSKKMGNAVARNLIKRRLREIYRRSKSRLPYTQDVVLIPDSGHGPATLAEYQLAFDAFIEWSKRPRPEKKGRKSRGKWQGPAKSSGDSSSGKTGSKP